LTKANLCALKDMGKVAILGGTFDPVHWGHLLLAETAASQMNLNQVIWALADHPPHKQVSAYQHRRFMLESAIADNPSFLLYEVETTSTGPDYAITTLSNLQEAYPNCQWYWIIGLDAFQTLPRWYQREKLIPACEWLVAPRPGDVAASAPLFHTSDNSRWELCQQVAQKLAQEKISIRWELLSMPEVGISSSLIRQYCRQGRSIRYLVPESVRTYINSHNLYLESINQDQT
jgi:nicotinate-nucleotide adenylyltransferase